MLLPLGGLSVIDSPDGPFWWPEANQALFDAIKKNIRDDIAVIEVEANVNDPEFSRRTATTLLEMMATS